MRALLVLAACTAAAARKMQYELLETYESVADAAATVVVGKARFTVLTDSLVRMEYAQGAFEDRPTLAFVNRKTPVPKFTQTQANGTLTIATAALKLTYTPGTGNFATAQKLSVEPLGASTFTPWTYGQTSLSDAGNLRGTIRTLDTTGNITLACSEYETKHPDRHCESGLVSRTGWALVDETGVPCLEDDDWWTDDNGKLFQNADEEDLYLFAHSQRYRDAMKDFRLVGGAIPMLPRSSLGVWFTRWYDWSAQDAYHLVAEYEHHGFPLDVLILDMNWHKKNSWTGYTFDPNLWPQAKESLGRIKARGVTMAGNLHDDAGVSDWEEAFPAMCKAVGCDPAKKTITTDFTSKQYMFALEDVVLKPLEETAFDFFWIDWQQGENAHGTGQDGPRWKMNPTILTDKLRATDSIRRCRQQGDCTNKRGVTFARFGGLGNHRYQHGFSGDVADLTWANMAYQTYFSATAANVGYGYWSHDIVGPAHDPELTARWVQVGAFSGLMRSHDRGMSGGGCAGWGLDGNDCTVVNLAYLPWAWREVVREALLAREELLPYTYTGNRVAFETGVSFLHPMYYDFPEEAAAYPASMDGDLGQNPSTRQYMLGDDILVAPVTTSSGCATAGDEPCGLAAQDVWVPPGDWIEAHTGKVLTGPKTVHRHFHAEDVPLYVKAGAVIPTLPLQRMYGAPEPAAGGLVGVAARQYTDLVFTIYPGAASGSGVVYEDDAVSYDYLSGKYAWTTLNYTRTGDSVKVTIATAGAYAALPAQRRYTVRFVNSMPVAKTSAGSAWYDGAAVTAAVTVDGVAVASGASLDVAFEAGGAALAGAKGWMRKAELAKRALNEARANPNEASVAKDNALSQLASLPQLLTHAAAAGDAAGFGATAASVATNITAAIAQITPIATASHRSACVAKNGQDAVMPLRAAGYENGITAADAGACCDVCSKEAKCVAYVFDTTGSKMCYVLSVVGGIKAADNRILGTPKSFTRAQYALDLLLSATE
eukprot:TRINITY_DN4590_c0_g1_i3.p1 TRINITY_DN4590_c0_g1~~TRINITY_DN4590_c0_g1_i3.p1  ORF type:complete len:994 (+),score=371.47 TRINITY_DN4590_c0_g1_i3:66-3047(+)